MAHLIFLFLLPQGHAQTMNISYGSPSWNTDSRKIDSAYMVMKDETSGKLVQIQLEETEPDSSKFDGQFNVDFGSGQLKPLVFVPPKELRNPERDYQKVHKLIQGHQLKAKPLITKQNEKGQTLLDVYDTEEQAEAARKAYEDEQRLKVEAEKQKLVKPVPDEKRVAAAAAAEKQALVAKLALEAARRESDRVRLEQIERQKALERERALKAASEAERAARRAKAKALVEEAMRFFNAGDFRAAEDKFRAAVDLDPEDKSHYYRYGVALYKNNKFNEALVILKLAEVEPALEIERRYFVGLTHYRLNELDAAEENLAAASGSKDPVMGPSAMFYLGVVQFTKGRLEPAKANFERVIDTSQDPRMDQEAENYIERIAQALMFKKLQEKPWTTTGIVGLQYDSNVLLTPDNTGTQGASLKEGDVRLSTVADVAYRAIYLEKHEWALKGNLNLLNSANSNLSKADPFLFNFSAPYSHKGVTFKKGHVMTFRPAYESLFMDPNSTGTKTNILSAIVLAFDNTFVMRPTWFANYSLEARQDNFNIAGNSGDNEYDAMKYTFKTTQTFYRDQTRKEALATTFGFTFNGAEGKNRKFTRFDLGATYSRPMKWGYALNTGLNAYQLNYNNADDKRADFNLTFTAGLDKPFREWATWSVTGSFTKNDSNVASSYEYDKFVIMTSATFSTNL